MHANVLWLLLMAAWLGVLTYGAYRRLRFLVDPPAWTLWVLWGPAVLRLLLSPDETRRMLIFGNGVLLVLILVFLVFQVLPIAGAG
jgi:hypothetical protein